MKNEIAILTVAAAAWIITPRTAAAVGPETSSASRSEIVYVAPPTGDPAKDHASIVSAFRQARPGDTSRFAHGKYVVGDIIEVPTPKLTFVGDPHGTVLRGCNPDAYEKLARKEVGIIKKLIKSHNKGGPGPRWAALVKRCGMFQLTGGHDVVRNLTFEYMRIGVMLGDRYQLGRLSAEGGYLIEDNTFRNTDNSVRVGLISQEPTVIRHNTFVDTFHAVSAGGSNIRVLDNTMVAPAPGRVPGQQYPSIAIGVTPMAPGQKDSSAPSEGRCGNNVIAGNVIDGYPDGIALGTFPGTVCGRNVIRGNTIAVHRAVLLPTSTDVDLFPLADETHHSFVGVPITVRGGLIHNRIEGNRILGAEGYGIAIVHSSKNRIADNTVTGVVLRHPFPGNTSSSPSRNANGSGIWVSVGSNGNEISGNMFNDIAAYAIVLEGNHNIVRTRSTNDIVRDMGTWNRVTKPDPH